jgi:tetratricopeptide (TPR) repeat protein
MSEKTYLKNIEQGVSFLKKTLESNSPKKTVSLARKSVKSLKKAIMVANEVGPSLRKKIPFIYEYLQQVQAQQGASLLEINRPKDAIIVFESALFSNEKSPQSTKQQEIKSLILAELAKIYANFLGNAKKAEFYANQALQIGSKIKYNQEDLLDLYFTLNSIFLRSGNFKKLAKNYRTMIKLAKKDKRKHLKAEVYFSYGKFLFGIENNLSDSRKYLQKSQTLFQALKIQQGYDDVVKFIKDRLEPAEKIINNEKEMNTT